MGASPPCPHAAIRIAATPASSAHQQASWGTTGVLHGLNQRFLRSQKADSAGCVHRAEEAGTFVNGGTNPSGVVFPIGTSFFGPGFGLEPSGERRGRVRKSAKRTGRGSLRACVRRKFVHRVRVGRVASYVKRIGFMVFSEHNFFD